MSATSASRTRCSWRRPRRAAVATPHAPTAAAPATATQLAPPKKPAATAKASSSSELTLVINLERRPDRIAALERLKLPFEWSRMDAVDGRKLDWDALGNPRGDGDFDGLVHQDAVKEAKWAQSKAMPTICKRTGSFSPHLTLGAVGIALSQRKCWQRLLASTSTDYALILEDDISSYAPDFNRKLQRLLRMLPPTWCVCFLGFHESTGKLLRAGQDPRIMEVPNGAVLTGLYGYLVHKRGAKALLAQGALFPLRHQVDVAVSQMAWPRGSRFAIDPEGVLLTSPKSEEGKCDTDIQTLGKPSERAHAELPRSMLRL